MPVGADAKEVVQVATLFIAGRGVRLWPRPPALKQQRCPVTPTAARPPGFELR